MNRREERAFTQSPPKRGSFNWPFSFFVISFHFFYVSCARVQDNKSACKFSFYRKITWNIFNIFSERPQYFTVRRVEVEAGHHEVTLVVGFYTTNWFWQNAVSAEGVASWQRRTLPWWLFSCSGSEIIFEFCNFLSGESFVKKHCSSHAFTPNYWRS